MQNLDLLACVTYSLVDYVIIAYISLYKLIFNKMNSFILTYFTSEPVIQPSRSRPMKSLGAPVYGL